jgi:hypothetical protein
MNLIEIPSIDDIAYFVGTNSRAENDAANRIREDILTCLYSDIPNEYFANETYGKIWRNICDEFKSAIDSLAKDIEYTSVELEKKAGMSHNYDFIVKYLDSNRYVVKSIKLEFKNNNVSIDKLPQFLELYDKDMAGKYDMIEYTYSEFYYNNYLDDYLALDDTIIVDKPDLAVYLDKVKDIKYSHPFFNNLYKSKLNMKKEKQELVDASIRVYLQDYAPNFNFTEIEKKIKESQTNKTFLFWNGSSFIIDTIDVDEIEIVGIKKINDKFVDLDVKGIKFDLRLRFNWGNNNGVANPRWKFTFIEKK